MNTVNTVTSPEWTEVAPGVSTCAHNPKYMIHNTPGYLYHCPVCYVMVAAGCMHPSDAVTKILLSMQNLGINIKTALVKKYPKDHDVESWLRDDD